MSIRYSADKDLNRAIRKLIRTGWKFRRGRRHGRLLGPAGIHVVVATTPSDHRTLANFCAQVRRLTR